LNKKIVIFTLLLLTLSSAIAQNTDDYGQVIINSANWQDVYSGMLYANLIGVKGNFLVSNRHSTLLLNQISPSGGKVLLASSDKTPYVIGYAGVLRSRDFEVDELSSSEINIELATKLSDIKRFIVVDDSYGYNAISVAPYAVLDKAYVLFVDRRNINRVFSFLSSRGVDELVLYGQVDREVKDRLAEFNPTVINEGDRFNNNFKIVDMYQEKHKQLKGEPKRQVILTNGEFIEQEIMSGAEPIVFIGRSNVPEVVREYIQGSDVEIGVLIGNELIGTATFVKRQLGISVFVKFAQSARNPTSAISQVEDLDRFYLPRYILELDIYEARYNQFNNQLEVTYQNKVDLSSYFKGTVTLQYEGGTQTVGDVEPIFIDKGEFKTVVYDIDPISAEAIRADIFTIYGESKNALEYTLRKTVDVSVVNIEDDSNIDIVDVQYDKRKDNFLVRVKNIGPVDVFVNLEMFDLLVNDELSTFGADEIVFIEVGKTATIPINVALDDIDIENNPKVNVRAYYGERERSLIKVLSGEYEFSLVGLGYMTGQLFKDLGEGAMIYGPMLIIVILLILVLSMKKKCPNCGEVNKVRAKRCKKCNEEI
jgi:hypothetical protein